MKKTITGFVLKSSPLLLVEAGMSIVVSLCVTRGNALISGLVDESLQGGAVAYQGYMPIFAGLVAAGFAAAFARRFCAGVFANRICVQYRNRIAEKLYRLEYRFFSVHSTGAVLNKVIGDINIIAELLESVLPEMIGNVIAILIYAVYIARMDLGLFILMLIAYPIIFWIANILVKKMQKLTLTYREKADAMAEIAQSAVSGILVVRAFRLEVLFGRKMKEAADALVENEQRRTSLTNATLILKQMLQWLPNILCALYAVYLVSREAFSLGNLLAFVLILGRFVDAFIGLPFLFVDATAGMVSIDRIEGILAEKEEGGGEYRGEKYHGGESCDKAKMIEFDHVSFSYESFCESFCESFYERSCEQLMKAEKVLDDISLTIAEHDRIALIGESGGGKSTLAGLLCGFYDDYEGEIRVCGRDVREWDREALRDKISFVSQDVFLFPVSIEENVAFGSENASHEAVVEACREANIHEFIESLPEGYQTIVGERGAKLSGGQRQRLSIARAILKDADIMILDEPTSSVDVETENEIQREIEKIGENKTCITIAHRLNTIKNCDYVYRLDGGKLELQKGGKAQLRERTAADSLEGEGDAK